MKQLYEATRDFPRNGLTVTAGTRLSLHPNEAKYLAHVLQPATATSAEPVPATQPVSTAPVVAGEIIRAVRTRAKRREA